jgi:hypothetical protein
VELDKLGWTPSPTRDPFGGAVQVAPTISNKEAAPATDVLDLKAVWLQEGGGLAVINGKVLGEGDAILDFRLEKVFADGVLVQGPGGRRQVGFKPASAKPRPSPVAAPSSPLAKAPPTTAPGNPVTRIPGVPLKLTPSSPLTLEDVTKVLGQVFSPDSTSVTGRPKSPEKSGP